MAVEALFGNYLGESMIQYSYPTTIYFGEDALEALAETLKNKGHKSILLVTDANLRAIGLVDQVCSVLKLSGAKIIIFDDVHGNPLEEDVELGTEFFLRHDCDALIALGGGSPMYVAKVIKVAATHPGPLSRYDDALGGDKLIVNEMPPLYAIPTTAGTGSEVGRSGVIIMRQTQKKTIIFSPSLMPDIAVLVPQLSEGLPKAITAATGIDAFTHSLEAYLAPGFDPMADGLAIESMRLCIENLDKCVINGSNLKARGKMQLAATMGATAFQKGLGMIHSLAHPLSAHCNTHHGLANALILPAALEFLERSDLNEAQHERIGRVLDLFKSAGFPVSTLSNTCYLWFIRLGIEFGLAHHGISEDSLAFLADEAFEDPCHATNMIQVNHDDLLSVYLKAF